MINYQDIFSKTEKALRNASWFSDTEFDNQYGHFKTYANKKRSDQELFELLTMIVFYSGFKASTIEKKKEVILGHFPNYMTVSDFTDSEYQRIVSDPKMIKNKRKISATLSNAKTIRSIVKHHGSFQKYIDSFEPDKSFENLILLKEEFEYKFEYLGGTTVYHFLTDLGFNVLKPDRVLLRIFNRLGLIESEKQLLKTVIHGRKFSEACDLPIRYIDIVFVKYGQQGKSIEFGLDDGICLKKIPRCHLCDLKEYCQYYKESNQI